MLCTKPLLLFRSVFSFLSKCFSNLNPSPFYKLKITTFCVYKNFSVESGQDQLLFFLIEKTVHEWQGLVAYIFLINQNILSLRHFIEFQVIGMRQYKQILAIILEWHMINPHIHVG